MEPHAPSAELLILLAKLAADRDRKGAKWCERYGVGAERRLIASALAVIPMERAKTPEFAALTHARIDAAGILACVCRSCGKCKLAKL